MSPILGVHTLQADFLDPKSESLIRTLMAGPKGTKDGKADVILCDMAANATGNYVHDSESSLKICTAVFEFAQRNLRTTREIGRSAGGVLLIKHFAHPLLHTFRAEQLEKCFHTVRHIKPQASRAESKEGYYLCLGWKGR